MQLDPSILFVCPYCHGKLQGDKEIGFRCVPCGNDYRIDQGIYYFFNPDNERWIQTDGMIQKTLQTVTPGPVSPGHPYIFFDGSAVKQDSPQIAPTANGAFFNIIFEFLHDVLIDKEDRVLLEIGAGDGWASYLLSRYHPVIAVEPMQDIIQHINPDYGCGITRVVADGKSLPLPAQSVDAIFMVSAYHHMVHYTDALNEWWRVLKYGGRLIAVGEMYFSTEHFAKTAEYDREHGEWGYTYEELTEAFDNCAFGFINHWRILYQDYMQYMLSDQLIKHGKSNNGIIVAVK